MFKYLVDGEEVKRENLIKIIGENTLRSFESEAYNLFMEESESEFTIKAQSGEKITLIYNK
jgi:hypothetical protein